LIEVLGNNYELLIKQTKFRIYKLLKTKKHHSGKSLAKNMLRIATFG